MPTTPLIHPPPNLPPQIPSDRLSGRWAVPTLQWSTLGHGLLYLLRQREASTTNREASTDPAEASTGDREPSTGAAEASTGDRELSTSDRELSTGVVMLHHNCHFIQQRSSMFFP